MAFSDAGNRRAFEKRVMRHMFSTFLLWYISKHRTHGYELIKRLDEEEKFHVITASQLYPMLNSLLKQGLISQERVMQGKRVRKVYNITGAGRAALAQAKKCMCESPLKRQFLREMVK
ncbi:MAG: PadR family transcriptional regulator [Candidatus Micrarchaeota archaeon]